MRTFSIAFTTFVLLTAMSFAQGTEKKAQQDPTAPKVISTFPKNGATNVDTSVKEIWIQFDKAMMDKSWSWAYTEKSKFPQLNGAPYYSQENTKNILPVKLEANHEYDIWINTQQLKGFQDKTGAPAEPFELKFKTK